MEFDILKDFLESKMTLSAFSKKNKTYSEKVKKTIRVQLHKLVRVDEIQPDPRLIFNRFFSLRDITSNREPILDLISKYEDFLNAKDEFYNRKLYELTVGEFLSLIRNRHEKY